MIVTSAPINEGVSYFVINEGVHINKTNLQSYFEVGLQYVLTQVEYTCPMKYSTWCKILNHTAITKKGSGNNKALVEASNTIYNNPHKPKKKMKLSNIRVAVQRRRAGNI